MNEASSRRSNDASLEVPFPTALTRINPKHARVATLWWSAPIQETTMYQRILVPVDGSATSDCGLDESIRLAKLTGARLRLVHVVDSLIFSTGMEFATADIVGILMGAGAEILATAKARVEASGVPVETFLSESLGSRICDVVVAQARLWKADLVVIGTHGRRGVGRLFIISTSVVTLVFLFETRSLKTGSGTEREFWFPPPATMSPSLCPSVTMNRFSRSSISFP